LQDLIIVIKSLSCTQVPRTVAVMVLVSVQDLQGCEKWGASF